MNVPDTKTVVWEGVGEDVTSEDNGFNIQGMSPDHAMSPTMTLFFVGEKRL